MIANISLNNYNKNKPYGYLNLWEWIQNFGLMITLFDQYTSSNKVVSFLLII